MAALKIFFVLLFIPILSQAEVSDCVVKIRSAYSSNSVQPRVGSGLLIKWQNRFLVLTSDHVIFHSNRSFSHKNDRQWGTIPRFDLFVV